MLGRLWTCCRVVWIIVWTIAWFLVRCSVLPVAMLCGFFLATLVGFLEWLILGSSHVWNWWLAVNDTASKWIPQL